MITSSNFFSKNLFADDEQELIIPLNQEKQVGPWVENDKQKRYASLDAKMKRQRGQNHSLMPVYHPIKSSRYVEHHRTGSQVQIQFQQPNRKSENAKPRKDKQIMFNLPRIQAKAKSPRFRDHVSSRKQSLSPLAAELNFICRSGKYHNNKKKNKNYLLGPDRESPIPIRRLESYLAKNSKYDIYAKCVIEIKKNNTINIDRRHKLD